MRCVGRSWAAQPEDEPHRNCIFFLYQKSAQIEGFASADGFVFVPPSPREWLLFKAPAAASASVSLRLSRPAWQAGKVSHTKAARPTLQQRQRRGSIPSISTTTTTTSSSSSSSCVQRLLNAVEPPSWNAALQSRRRAQRCRAAPHGAPVNSPGRSQWERASCERWEDGGTVAAPARLLLRLRSHSG